VRGAATKQVIRMAFVPLALCSVLDVDDFRAAPHDLSMSADSDGPCSATLSNYDAAKIIKKLLLMGAG